MRSSMVLLVGLFAAVASAIVLLRLSLDVSLRAQSGHVMYPLAIGILAASLSVIAATVVSSDRRTTMRLGRGMSKARFDD